MILKIIIVEKFHIFKSDTFIYFYFIIAFRKLILAVERERWTAPRVEEQSRESSPIWKGSSIRGSINSGLLSGLLPLPEAEKTKRKMKISFLKGLKTFTTLISRVRNPTPLIKYSKFEVFIQKFKRKSS